MYKVIDRKHDDKIIGTYKNKRRAQNLRDRLDNEYGAYIHRIYDTEREMFLV